MLFDQAEFQLRCEWGAPGVAQLAPTSDVVIIVDVLSFSTSVEIATSRGALIFPYPWNDESARTFATSVGAEVANPKRDGAGYSLSPQSLINIPAGARLVLPSPNGSTLTLGTGATPTLAGCLRNSRAVARAAQRYGKHIAVIPAGERWQDGSLRPAFEDWVGAGAILNHLCQEFSPDALSPEVRAAVAAFEAAQSNLSSLLRQCGSGKELIERNCEPDIVLASQRDISTGVPVFVNGAYRQ